MQDRKSKNPQQFNPINSITRFMHLNVRNLSWLWLYFDPTIYPRAVQNIPLGPEIFYTITKTIKGLGGGLVP
jgi:hypothetical protein